MSWNWDEWNERVDYRFSTRKAGEVIDWRKEARSFAGYAGKVGPHTLVWTLGAYVVSILVCLLGICLIAMLMSIVEPAVGMNALPAEVVETIP